MSFPAGPTELDAAWLEDTLRGAGIATARVRKLNCEVIGVGFGLDGTLVRVTIDGDGGVPATLVAKWCSAKFASQETRFYREIAPRLDLSLARLLTSSIDEAADRGFLLLSDVAPAKQGDVLVGATANEADALVDAMAELHARFWAADFGGELGWLASCPRDRELACRQIRERLPRFLAEWSGRLAPGEIEALRGLDERLERAHAVLAAAPQTIVHTDLHLDNVLFPPDGRAVILDWTDIARGAAVLDFTRLTFENMTTQSRRALGAHLAERYLRELAARGVRDYGAERLREDAQAAATMCFAATVRWAAGPDPLGFGVPRVAAVVESLVRRGAALVADGVTPR